MKELFMKSIKYLFLSTLFLGNGTALAASPDVQFISSAAIVNQPQVLRQLKSQTTAPVVFPAKIPAPEAGGSLYASVTHYAGQANYTSAWQINVDATPDCAGVRTCNIGYIAAEKNGKLSLSYETLPENKSHVKERVTLPHHITGYYTPFHVQASGVNPTVEWRENDILYILSWRIPGTPAQQKQILLHILSSRPG
jgi:hypothetical protein